jgi:hypothetical protein
MPRWRVKNPGAFPANFHEAMMAGEGVDKVVTRRYTEVSVRRDAEDFRLFRFCLRHYPGYPAARPEMELKHRTKVRWNPDHRMWELLLTSRRDVLADMVEMS